MKRRHFLQTAATASLSLAPSSALRAALAKNDRFREAIGLQLYTLRNEIAKDTAGTIKAVAEAGYKQVEPYRSPQTEAMIQAAKDHGLAVNSMHFDWNTVVAPKDEGMSDFRKTLEEAKAHGLTHLVIPYLDASQRKTLDDYKKVAARSNQAAILAKAAGIQLAYHNHSFEFEPMGDGKTGFDVLMAEFAPEMKFEIDVFWVKAGAVEPLDLMKRLKGRVSQLHLKDLKAGLALPIFTNMPVDGFKELGNGIIPMEPIITLAAEIGVAHCHVEQDQSPDPLASVRQSLKYLAAL
ncbi:MAG: sugar phosphate isomerase/epimerase family protein [Verrucomicrobiales bacterium]